MLFRSFLFLNGYYHILFWCDCVERCGVFVWIFVLSPFCTYYTHQSGLPATRWLVLWHMSTLVAVFLFHLTAVTLKNNEISVLFHVKFTQSKIRKKSRRNSFGAIDVTKSRINLRNNLKHLTVCNYKLGNPKSIHFFIFFYWKVLNIYRIHFKVFVGNIRVWLRWMHHFIHDININFFPYYIRFKKSLTIL